MLFSVITLVYVRHFAWYLVSNIMTWRSRDELIRDVLLWTPTYGRAKAGRPVRTYIQQLCEDTGCSPEDQPEAMNDWKKWRERVRDIRAGGTTWWWWWWWISRKVVLVVYGREIKKLMVESFIFIKVQNTLCKIIRYMTLFSNFQSKWDRTSLKLVDKFTYQGSSVSSTEKDIDTRVTKAWTAIDRLSIIWKSDLTDKMKRSFFQAAVVSILLYGCTTWTLTKRLEKKLDGNYTRMLRAILNKSWRQHPSRHQLYGHLPPITKTIQVRRTRHAGHCWRSRDELTVMWTLVKKEKKKKKLKLKKTGEKAGWEELRKNATSCFEQILEWLNGNVQSLA